VFVQKLLRIILNAVSGFCALLGAYATVTAFQGDDSASAAAVFFGILAIVAFALRKPVSWLAGKALGVITPPLRRMTAAVPRPGWESRLPRQRWPRRATGMLPAIIAASRMDEIGLLPVVFSPEDPAAEWAAEEEIAEQHMRAHGFPDAWLTGPRLADGVDVVAKTAVARVTTQQQPVSVPMVRRLRDTLPDLASHLFYSTSGYTKITVATADKIGVSLFHINGHDVVEPVNAAARRITARRGRKP
jgi:hypothetical protein